MGFRSFPCCCQGCDGFYEYNCHILFSGSGVTDSYFIGNAGLVTAFIKNTGPCRLTLLLQNSPNAHEFIDDPQRLELDPGQTGYLVPYIFSKYIRVSAAAEGPGSLCLWLQTQNNSC